MAIVTLGNTRARARSARVSPYPETREPARRQRNRGQQDDARPEHRDGQRDRRVAADCVVDESVASRCRPPGERRGDHHRQPRPEQDQHQAEREARPDHLGHRIPAPDGGAEVPLCRVDDVAQVLLEEWPVQAELSPDLGDLLLGRSRSRDGARRVARGDLQQREHHEQHTEKQRHQPRKAAYQVPGAPAHRIVPGALVRPSGEESTRFHRSPRDGTGSLVAHREGSITPGEALVDGGEVPVDLDQPAST